MQYADTAAMSKFWNAVNFEMMFAQVQKLTECYPPKQENTDSNTSLHHSIVTSFSQLTPEM